MSTLLNKYHKFYKVKLNQGVRGIKKSKKLVTLVCERPYSKLTWPKITRAKKISTNSTIEIYLIIIESVRQGLPSIFRQSSFDTDYQKKTSHVFLSLVSMTPTSSFTLSLLCQNLRSIVVTESAI